VKAQNRDRITAIAGSSREYTGSRQGCRRVCRELPLDREGRAGKEGVGVERACPLYTNRAGMARIKAGSGKQGGGVGAFLEEPVYTYT